MTPIAWYDPTNGVVSTDKNDSRFTPAGQVLPLYPQRTWVELTAEEIIDVANAELSPKSFSRGVAWANAKLKEKNT